MAVQVLPRDEYDGRLVANVHPPDWVNPEPAPRYNLVVIGAGTAGLVTAAGFGVIHDCLGARRPVPSSHPDRRLASDISCMARFPRPVPAVPVPLVCQVP
jgi:hypothetical protein